MSLIFQPFKYMYSQLRRKNPDLQLICEVFDRIELNFENNQLNINNLATPATPTGVFSIVSVYSDQLITYPTSTDTAVSWNHEAYKFGTDISHSNVTNNTRLSINTTGIYHVSYHMQPNSISNPGLGVGGFGDAIGVSAYICHVLLNGVTQPDSNVLSSGSFHDTTDSFHSDLADMTATGLVSITAGQYLELFFNPFTPNNVASITYSHGRTLTYLQVFGPIPHN